MEIENQFWNRQTLIWLNQKKALDRETLVCLNSWLQLEGWSIEFLFDRDLEGFPISSENAKNCKHPAQIADLLRLESVYEKGGFYTDTDVYASPTASRLPKMVEQIIRENNLGGKNILICCNEENNNFTKFISNAFFGSTPKNPLLKLILTEARESLIRLKSLPINEATGPWCWSRALQKAVLGGLAKQPIWKSCDNLKYWLIPTTQIYDGVVVMLHSTAWYPWLWNVDSERILDRVQSGQAPGFGAHLWHKSWKATVTLTEKPRLFYITQIVGYNPTRVDVWHRVMHRNIVDNHFLALFDIFAFTYREDDANSLAILADLQNWIPTERLLAVPYREELFNRGLGHNLVVEKLNNHYGLQPDDQLMFIDGDLWFLNKDAAEIAHRLRTTSGKIVATKLAVQVIDQNGLDLCPSQWTARAGMCFSGGAVAFTYARHIAMGGWPIEYPVYGFEDAEMDIRICGQCAKIEEELAVIPIRARHTMSVVEPISSQYFGQNKTRFDAKCLLDYRKIRPSLGPLVKKAQLALDMTSSHFSTQS